MNKTKTIASGCWYAARHRAIPYIGKHAFALLTFLYFFFILGVGGGVDAWLLDDPKAVFMILLGTGVWIASLAIVMIIKGFWAMHTEKAAHGVGSTEGGKEKIS